MLDFIPTAFRLPRQLTFSRSIEEPLTLENLRASNYKMIENEIDGFDVAHARLAIEALGKFHALGMVFFSKTNLEDENLKELFDLEMMKMITEPLLAFYDDGIKAIVDWTENNAEYGDVAIKLNNLLHERKYLKKVNELFEEGKNDALKVFQHGDARCNNILFKYAEDDLTPVKVKIVDYHLSFCSTPVFDLVFFLVVSLSAETFKHHFDHLMERYRTSMVSTLTSLNYNKAFPSMDFLRTKITYFSPMTLPNICGVVNFIIKNGSQKLNSEQRRQKIKSVVDTCLYLKVF